MSIYNLDGTEINSAYDIDGTATADVYDVEGNIIGRDVFTVMTYNVMRWEGLNANKTIQDEAFITRNADIIGIQEWGYNASGGSVGGIPVLTYLDDCGYSEIEVGTSIYNKNALLSKLALSSIQEIVFAQDSSTSYQKCYFTYNGKTICWINTHLLTSSQESGKVAEAKVIFDAVENEEYFIITGDFNTVCKSVNDTEYTTIMKQFVDAGYNVGNCSQQFGFIDTWTDGTTINDTWYPCDIIITSSNINMISVERDMTKVEAATGSVIDHVPFIAYLQIN